MFCWCICVCFLYRCMDNKYFHMQENVLMIKCRIKGGYWPFVCCFFFRLEEQRLVSVACLYMHLSLFLWNYQRGWWPVVVITKYCLVTDFLLLCFSRSISSTTPAAGIIPNTQRRRRRDSTVEYCRVAICESDVHHHQISQLAQILLIEFPDFNFHTQSCMYISQAN